MADRLQMRVIDDDGRIGRTIGEASLDGDEVRYFGSRVLRDKLTSFANNRRITVGEAFALLCADPWSNGRLALGPSSPVARIVRLREQVTSMRERHRLVNDDYVRDGKGRFAKHAALKDALTQLGGELGGKYFDDVEGMEPGRYVDISHDSEAGNDYYSLEIGADNEAAIIPLHRDEMRGLASAMAVSILQSEKDETPDSADPRSVLLASITSLGEKGGYHPGDPRSDEPITDTTRNFDWSHDKGNETWLFEASSDDTDATAFTLTDEEFRALHASIALQLAEDD